MWIIIFLIVIIIVLVYKYFKMENFESNDPIRHKMILENINDVNGYEDGPYVEYRSLYSQFPLGIWRKHDFEANKWETKLPSLVEPRYCTDHHPMTSRCGYPVGAPDGISPEHPDDTKLSVESLLAPRY